MKTVFEVDALLPAPFGYVGVRCAGSGTSSADEIVCLLAPLPVKAQPHPRAQAVVCQINNYFYHPHYVWQPLQAGRGTPFQQRVWAAMRAIPVGETRTYAQLAARVQSGARAVANACGANPLPLFNPCHRVVASDGLGGFMQGMTGGLDIKRWLLAHEQSVSSQSPK